MRRPTRPSFPGTIRYRFPAPNDAPPADAADELAFAIDFFAAYAALVALVVVLAVLFAVPLASVLWAQS